MPIKVTNQKPSTRSADREVEEIIRRLEYSRNSGKSTFSKSDDNLLRNGSKPHFTSGPQSTLLRNSSESQPASLLNSYITPLKASETEINLNNRRSRRGDSMEKLSSNGLEVPPLGRTMAMHKADPALENSVYQNDFKNVDPQVLKEVALKNSRYMSNQNGFFTLTTTDRRNHPGAGLVKNVLNATGKQSSYITTYPPPPVPRELVKEELVRYSAPTFTSDVLGQQGATFMQPGESSYMQQYRNYSDTMDPIDIRARPMTLNRQMRRNCPHPEGTSNILTHDGKIIRVMAETNNNNNSNTAVQSAPAYPFDTRHSDPDVRQSALKKEEATRKELEGLYDLWPMIKVPSKESSNRHTAEEAASESYKKQHNRSVRDYMHNRNSGWRWAPDKQDDNNNNSVYDNNRNLYR
ncbi:uncharacterized protein LOC142354695 [Convolutriloba macropyga]|uniref:uncharacterized protein LOC142354695 n=1 Tax=Convolutriloba macropyga TaxID=536237 RepID=UPI003F521AA0